MSVCGMPPPTAQFAPPGPAGAAQQLIKTGIEFATALADFTTTLVQNQESAAQLVAEAPSPPRMCGSGPAAASSTPMAVMSKPMQPAMFGGPLGGILEQVMQLLQMLTPLLMQMAGSSAPKPTATAATVASQMPGARGQTMATPARSSSTAKPGASTSSATSSTPTATPTATATATPTLSAAPPQSAAEAAFMAERYPVINVSMSGNTPATRETARAWVYTTMGTMDVSDFDMQNGMALYGIFTNGTPFR